ncbi:MAG: hypothetical protein A2186_01850 [Candidatus Levybacteria bacterium RIFOXYA1_FULL_41_10]|uniref:Uncharacterized protein n=1 Tax=Candidatus Gottesmanbacteria bacterium GW2011_GWB1_44_11c TaxID=1618447 RepID=A0A0G1GRL9_9BACT|nr:MAG: hypothetical protein UT44_C0013G0009 [Candidatus Levybacteria bacterium GW2011_GWA1_39_32]KKR50484.1 MAG: hypothetical protein UT87_C0016G0007 [Candidatus Levybacteria bacterium GW2011_GWC1_40_19]KKR95176.1 MAG: hypothetical protein UU45_C0004G0079 [Candidatus Levybacteria bacterium GW2011_GWA2_41_15]KKT37716.1 MAG: hypothetical protein UW22_C0019G0007 [Candidatus Gottesmanbacteria bacterium GW2011_GWB1_44_11c]OGH21197.1 MAG: hypothetical protein A2695_03630 [Candidatus Levybacteria bac
MKIETGYTAHIELTRMPTPSTLRIRRGSIIMAGGEPGGGEMRRPRSGPEKVEKPFEKPQADPKREALRKKWYSIFTPEELQNLDTKSTIEKAIELGYEPGQKTSKGPVEQTAESVVRTALLSDEEKISKADAIFKERYGADFELTPEQRAAIQEIHEVNRGQQGRNEALTAGAFNLKIGQLKREAEILRKVGFTEEQRRILIEAGIAANPLNPALYLDPRLTIIVAELNAEIARVGAGNALGRRFIDRQTERVQGLMDQGLVSNAQGLMLLGGLNVWMAEAEAGRYFTGKEEELIFTNEEERLRIFEEIFVGADAKYTMHFREALSLEDQSTISNFFHLLHNVRVYENGIEITDNVKKREKVRQVRQDVFNEFTNRLALREIYHNVHWAASGGGDEQAFVQAVENWESVHVDLTFRDPLVPLALHMYEQAFQQIKADNGGQLPYEELAWNPKTHSSNLENRVWKLMRRQVPANTPEWKLRSAVIMARGFGVASLRFPEIAAQARLPEGGPMSSVTERASRLGSIYGEKISRYLDPLEHIIEKFAIGEENRAWLYFFLTGEKSHFESKEQLDLALKMAAQLQGEDKRLIDIINLFRAGGPFSNSSWRLFMAMKDFTPEQIRISGVGVREARLSGDVEQRMRDEVAAHPDWAGKEPSDQEREARRRLKVEVVVGGREITEMDRRMHDERLAMWQDALKSNPLRVMWQWEEKSPGKRIEFLAEAILAGTPGLTPAQAEALAKANLSQAEEDLITIQEDTVKRLHRKSNPLTYAAPEMLNYNLIRNPQRRERVRLYVEKIRQKAAEKNYAFFESIFKKADVQGSPFPFFIGYEDMPLSDFDFINTGGRAFARRINDFANGAKASNELMGLLEDVPKINSIEPILERLDNMKKAMSQYDWKIAMEVTPYILRGIIRFYDKYAAARLPLGIGTLVGLTTDSSFAQEVFGREAMALDEGDKFNVTRHALRRQLASKEEIKKIRAELGASLGNVGIDVIRTYGQLAALLLMYRFAQDVSKEEK